MAAKWDGFRRWRRWLVRGAAVLLALTLAGELAARWVVGLGRPVLSVPHPRIEYMLAPSQEVQRFGRLIRVNAYGMRSDELPARKADPAEFRVLVLGDSVVNGGSLTDHQDLATSRLQGQLARHWRVPVAVMNASAGSWGPPNLLAYTQEFGFFDADVVVLVVSNHDAVDRPTFRPLDPVSMPIHHPWSALGEGLTRYLPRYAGYWWGGGSSPLEPVAFVDSDPEVLGAWRRLLVGALEQTSKVLVVEHLERSELEGSGDAVGRAALRKLAESLGVPQVSDREALAGALRSGKNPYRDFIHLNGEGQALLAEMMEVQLIRRAWGPVDGGATR